jgi:hypothetical protein
MSMRRLAVMMVSRTQGVQIDKNDTALYMAFRGYRSGGFLGYAVEKN